MAFPPLVVVVTVAFAPTVLQSKVLVTEATAVNWVKTVIGVAEEVHPFPFVIIKVIAANERNRIAAHR